MSTSRIRPPDRGQALEIAGVVAAFVLVAIVNLLGARHFRRWDVTQDKRWSLSPASLETLAALERPVDVWAIAGPGDPLRPSLRQLLTAYQAAAPRLEVHWIDPDRDAVQLVDLERRFGLEAGRSEDGRVATDAVVIVATADKHWFLTPQDLVEQADEVHVKPREERALTQAIRSVMGGDKAKLCFTSGHGELALSPGQDEHEWLGALRDLLEKNNYDLATVNPSAPDAHEPFAGCTTVVLAGPRSPFAPEETNRLRTWLLQGGSMLAAIGPIDAPTGLDEALAPFGIALDDQLVHEVDPAVAIPDTHGEGFFVSVRPHPVTAGLAAGPAPQAPKTAIFFARSLHHTSSPGTPWAAELLVTGPEAYAKTSIVGASTWNEAPARDKLDPRGPFVLAMAGERPSAGRGARVVVIGSRFALAEDNWRQPRVLHGTAFFVDSALSWLSARPPVVDVPDKAEVPAGMRISEQSRAEVRSYVLVLMPLAAVLMAIAVWAWRKSSEDRPYEVRHARGRP